VRCVLCLRCAWHREQAQGERHDAPNGTIPHGRLLQSHADLLLSSEAER
jgi:hypothetical protein